MQGDLVGVTRVDLKAGQLGALAVEGVFDFPKATGTGNGFTAGQLAYWDNTNDVATKTATGNKLIGKAVRAAAAIEPVVPIASRRRALPGPSATASPISRRTRGRAMVDSPRIRPPLWRRL